MPKIGVPELLILMAIVVLLFPKKIGAVFGGVGKGIAELRSALRGTKDFKEEVEKEVEGVRKEVGSL